MDKTDFRIISELERNARLSNTEIARKLKISEGTVRNRIQNMVKSKEIRRFTVELSTKAAFKAFTLVQTASDKTAKAVVKKIKAVPGVRRVFELAGKTDFMVELVTQSAEDANIALDDIRVVPGVKSTESLVVLRIN